MSPKNEKNKKPEQLEPKKNAEVLVAEITKEL